MLVVSNLGVVLRRHLTTTQPTSPFHLSSILKQLTANIVLASVTAAPRLLTGTASWCTQRLPDVPPGTRFIFTIPDLATLATTSISILFV